MDSNSGVEFESGYRFNLRAHQHFLAAITNPQAEIYSEYALKNPTEYEIGSQEEGSEVMSGDSATERIDFIDIARFYAMAMVFYGHFIEELMLLKNPAAASQYKFIYQLNKGPFNFHVYNFVVILFSSHGHMLLFPLTAIAGCALILLIAGMTRTQETIVWLGQNTFILMCLNGIFYHYINPPTAQWVLANLPHSALSIFGVGCVMTVVSLAICMPIVYVFTKFVPQLVGKPKVIGPILNNLI